MLKKPRFDAPLDELRFGMYESARCAKDNEEVLLMCPACGRRALLFKRLPDPEVDAWPPPSLLESIGKTLLDIPQDNWQAYCQVCRRETIGSLECPRCRELVDLRSFIYKRWF
jgi:hypothetical protein